MKQVLRLYTFVPQDGASLYCKYITETFISLLPPAVTEVYFTVMASAGHIISVLPGTIKVFDRPL